MLSASRRSWWRRWLPVTGLGLAVAGGLAWWASGQTPLWVELWLEDWGEGAVGGELDVVVTDASLAHVVIPTGTWTGQGWTLDGTEGFATFSWLPGPFELQSVTFGDLALTLDPRGPMAWPVPKNPPDPTPDHTALPGEPVGLLAQADLNAWPVPGTVIRADWDVPVLNSLLDGLAEFPLEDVDSPLRIRVLRDDAEPLEWPLDLRWTRLGDHREAAILGHGAPAEAELRFSATANQRAELSLALDLAPSATWEDWLGPDGLRPLAPAGTPPRWKRLKLESLLRLTRDQAPELAVLLEGRQIALGDVSSGPVIEHAVLAAEGSTPEDLRFNGALRFGSWAGEGWSLDPLEVTINYPAPRYLRLDVPKLGLQAGDMSAKGALRAFVEPPWLSHRPQTEWELALQSLQVTRTLSLKPFSVFGKARAGGWDVKLSPLELPELPGWRLSELHGDVAHDLSTASLEGQLVDASTGTTTLQGRLGYAQGNPYLHADLRTLEGPHRSELELEYWTNGPGAVVVQRLQLDLALLDTFRRLLPPSLADLKGQGSLYDPTGGGNQLVRTEAGGVTGQVLADLSIETLGSAALGWTLENLHGPVRLKNDFGLWLPQPEAEEDNTLWSGTDLQLERLVVKALGEFDLRASRFTVAEAGQGTLASRLVYTPTGAPALDLQAQLSWPTGQITPYRLQAQLRTPAREAFAPLRLDFTAEARLWPLVDSVELTGGGRLETLGPLKYALGPNLARARWEGELATTGTIRRTGALGLSMAGQGAVDLHDANLHWAATRFAKGLNLHLAWKLLGQTLSTDGVQELTLAEYRHGDERLTNLRVRFEIQRYPVVVIHTCTAEWRGGQVSLDPFTFNLTQPEFGTTLHLRGIEAQPILAQILGERLQVTGRLEGDVPIEYRNGRWNATHSLLRLDPAQRNTLRFTDRIIAEKYLDLGKQVPGEIQDRVVDAALEELPIDYFQLDLFAAERPEPLVLEFRLRGKTRELELEGITAKVKLNYFGDGVTPDDTGFELSLAAFLNHLRPPGR